MRRGPAYGDRRSRELDLNDSGFGSHRLWRGNSDGNLSGFDFGPGTPGDRWDRRPVGDDPRLWRGGPGHSDLDGHGSGGAGYGWRGMGRFDADSPAFDSPQRNPAWNASPGFYRTPARSDYRDDVDDNFTDFRRGNGSNLDFENRFVPFYGTPGLQR